MSEKIYKIRLEDKAAFLNRLKKHGVAVCQDCIETDTLNDPASFKIKFDNPEDIEIVNTILKQSPKLNKLKEVIKSLVKEELKRR